jgi:glycerate dehydrogenase
MKIVVTDGNTLNPGDLSWEPLGDIGQYEVFDRSSPEEVVNRCKDAEAALTNKVVFDDTVITDLPNLKYIGVTATGYNIIDIETAKKRRITVTNVPTYGTQSVAQMVFAHLFELAFNVGKHSQTVHEGKWSKCDNFCYWDYPLVELADMTMGIVGYGRIGREVGNIAKAFGMKVIAYDVFVKIDDADVKQVELDELFSNSDVVSLHCPLTKENEGMMNSACINKMKKSAFLINTSRGPLVNEKDLAEALNSGRIVGAGLDVLSTEPPEPDNPLLTAKNCNISPHIAWATRSARNRLLTTSIDNLKAFVKGQPQNVVG